MKVNCSKEKLLSAIQIVQKATATKTTLPILTGIYLSAEKGKLELQATDYEVGICVSIDAEVQTPGKTVLSGKYFPEMIRKLPGEVIDISSSSQDNLICVTAGRTEFRVLAFPASEFPVIKKFESNHMVIIKDEILRDLVKKTVFACSNDESRPLFTGALIEIDQGELRMVATNTHRLALRKAKSPDYQGTIKMIVPGKVLTEVARIVGGELPSDVKVYWLKNQIAFSLNQVYISSRLIEGQFPDYNKVIPVEFGTYCTIDTADLLDAVERVSLLSKDGDYNVIRCKFGNDQIHLAGNNPEAGSAVEVLELPVEGNSLEISFNAKYLMDVLKNTGAEKMRMSLNSPHTPALLQPVNDMDYLYILTPIRTA